MTELLSPAGNMSCLKAAISAGADAVYLAGASFGARAYAGNFSNDELLDAASLAHFHGKKLYITLNTLVTDKEMADALEFCRFLYENKICHGIIVQDIGVASEIKKNFPALSLHGSTQMCIHSPAGVKEASALGLDRVVIAREASRENIKACVETGVEIEAFIHGAYCVSRSGGCLMSSFIGKRSGNRGQCAQPCRLPYKNGYVLSLKDMCLAKHIPTLVSDGVASLKIEGRMKSPEYVYAVTSVYRGLLDEFRAADQKEYVYLENVFSRSGFSDGYYIERKGKNMFGIRKESDKEKTRGFEITAAEIPPKGVDIYGFFGVGESFVTAMCDGETHTVSGYTLKATGNGTTEDEICARLKKCGGTGFISRNVAVQAEDGIFMPASAVNALRRDALDGVKEKIIDKNRPKNSETPFICQKKDLLYMPIEGDIYRIYRPENGFIPPKDACRVDIPLWKLDKADIDLYGKEKVSVLLPAVIFPKEEKGVSDILKKARDMGITRVTVSNIGHIPLCQGFGVYGTEWLNVTNSRTAEYFRGVGLSGVCVSPEVTPAAVETDIGEYPVYGRQAVMHTENCIIKNTLGKCPADCVCTLEDRTGARFLMYGEYNHRNIIFNSVPTYLLDKKIPHNRVFVITDEKALPNDKPKDYTRGYFK